MANEFRHGTVGTELSQTEYESITGHSFDSQARGDIPISNAAGTGLDRLPIGSAGLPLTAGANDPAYATLDGVAAGNVANVNVVGGIPVLFRITASALTGNVDVTSTHKIRVLDVWAVGTGAGGASDTIQVFNGASAITNALDMNVVDTTVVRAGTIDDAQHEILAAGTLRVTGASAVNAEVYVLAIRVA